MPQMMPMLWLLMISTLISILLIISSFLYFFYCPLLYPNNKNKNFAYTWAWKW